jgi:hypothetical protein
VSIFCLLALAARSGFASQDESKTPDYSKESAIITSTETHLRYVADGTSVRTQTTSIKVLSDAGVRVHKADGSTVATPAENVLDLPSEVTRVAPMYSDLKQKQIPVKALGIRQLGGF